MNYLISRSYQELAKYHVVLSNVRKCQRQPELSIVLNVECHLTQETSLHVMPGRTTQPKTHQQDKQAIRLGIEGECDRKMMKADRGSRQSM